MESAVLPGLVEALGELYTAQPADPYAWMAHWFTTNAPPPRELLTEWAAPVLTAGAALVSDAGGSVHSKVLGAPLYDGT